MDLVVYDDDEKRYVPWAIALAAVLLVAVLTAVLTFVLARQASGGEGTQAVGGVGTPEPATAPTTASSAAPAPPASPTAVPGTAAPVAGATASDVCADALLRADAALDRAVAIDDALTQHTQIMDELLAERIDAQEALDRTLPVLTDGATERRRFEQDLSAYSQARQECQA